MQNLDFKIIDLNTQTKSGGTTQPGVLEDNVNWKGVKLFLHIASVLGTSPTLAVKVQQYNPFDRTYADITGASFASKTAAGDSVLTIYPGIDNSANVRLNDILPRGWRVFATLGGDTAVRATTRATGSTGGATAGKIFTLGSNVYTFVTSLTEAFAAALLKTDATQVVTGGNVTLNTTVYTFRTALTEVKATATITNGDTVNVTAGDTVTVGKWNPAGNGPKIYKFVAAITAANAAPTTYYEVLKGVDADTSLVNLAKAINNSATPGTEYGWNVVAHPEISANETLASHVMTLSARAVGQQGDQITLSKSAVSLTVSGAAFTGGVNAVPYEVLRDSSIAASLDNFKVAVNKGTGEGTKYSTGTLAHPTFTATNNTDTTQLVVAKARGVAYNGLALAKSSAPASHFVWRDQADGGTITVTQDGVDSIANEVIKGSTQDEMIQNMIDAIAATLAALGVTVSFATVASAEIEPVDGVITASHTDFRAKAGILAATANAFASTTNESNLAFTGATLAGGKDDPTFVFSVNGSYQV